MQVIIKFINIFLCIIHFSDKSYLVNANVDIDFNYILLYLHVITIWNVLWLSFKIFVNILVDWKKNHICDYRFDGFVSRSRYPEEKNEKKENPNNNIVKMNNGQIFYIIWTCRRNPSQTLVCSFRNIYQYKRIL